MPLTEPSLLSRGTLASGSIYSWKEIARFLGQTLVRSSAGGNTRTFTQFSKNRPGGV
jgi:hypothetical protein